MRGFNHHVLFLSLFLLLLFSAADDLKSDGAALLALSSALGGRSLWWNSSTPVCSWHGIVCGDSRVTEIHMPGRSLAGSIPDGIIGNLSALKFLSLRLNALTGTLPSDLSSLTNLESLYVQGNRLTGDIPAVLFTLPRLKRLSLGSNNFSGEIPQAFNNLTQLDNLSLEDNQLTGQIPDLNLPNLTRFNVSNNLLNGTIPEKLSVFPESSFTGNSLCGKPLVPCSDSEDSGGKKKLSGGAIAGIVIAVVVVVVALLLCLIFLFRKRKRDENAKTNKTKEINAAPSKEIHAEAAAPAAVAVEIPAAKDNSRSITEAVTTTPKSPPAATAVNAGGVSKKLVLFGNSPRVFDLDDLLRASAEVLGKGIYGTTYKASLDSGMAVAVKRLRDAAVSEDEFKAKMEEIGRLHHENLITLIGYHASGSERLLVYDYLPLGSLSALLHGNKAASGQTLLNWETRSTIALGAARGIAYIHSTAPTTSHGNIKSSNILLSKDFEARVSDSGLAQVVNPTIALNRVAGYRAPEVTDPRKVSQKADVYSFGVFLLELLTGKAPIVNEEGVDLPRWVQSVVREEWSSEVFDAELRKCNQSVVEDMVQLLQVAVDCTAKYPDNRPAMADVTKRIDHICSLTKEKTKVDGVEKPL